MKRCLITRPEHDHTVHYLSKWIESSIPVAEAKGITVFDLHRERASKKQVVSITSKENPSLVLLNGHGSAGMVTGHKDEPLFVAGDNEGLLKGKIVYALSCQSAKILGEKSVENGARAYIGYKDDFIFEYNEKKLTHPTQDEIAGLFLGPSCEVAHALLKGHTAGEAYSKSQDEFRKNLIKVLSSEGADSTTARYIWWDMKNQVCLGNKEAAF